MKSFLELKKTKQIAQKKKTMVLTQIYFQLRPISFHFQFFPDPGGKMNADPDPQSWFSSRAVHHFLLALQQGCSGGIRGAQTPSSDLYKRNFCKTFFYNNT